MEKLYLWDNEVPYYDESYGQEKPYLTPFIVSKNESGKLPGCVIVCPGGAYRARMEYEGDPICSFFNSCGISAFTLGYRCYPYNYSAIIADIKRAVRYVRYHADSFGINPDKIAVIGFSAGGNLALLGATQFDYGLETGDEIDRVSCRPDAAVLSYAVISLTDDITHTDTRNALIRHLNRDEQRKMIEKLSGEKAVKEDTPPMFLWHTSEDSCVPPEHSIRMASSLSAKKIPFELHIFQDGEHGLGLAEDVPGTREWSRLAADWLHRLGF